MSQRRRAGQSTAYQVDVLVDVHVQLLHDLDEQHFRARISEFVCKRGGRLSARTSMPFTTLPIGRYPSLSSPLPAPVTSRPALSFVLMNNRLARPFLAPGMPVSKEMVPFLLCTPGRTGSSRIPLVTHCFRDAAPQIPNCACCGVRVWVMLCVGSMHQLGVRGGCRTTRTIQSSTR